MANLQVAPGISEAALIELKSYNVALPMGTLAIGVDNIHHDVFLSPRFSQAARDYLFNLIRLSASANFFSGIELRDTQPIDAAAFRKILTEVMQSSLTQAKFRKNIEIDILFRLALLKFLSLEIGNQFVSLVQEGKEWVRQRGEQFERSQQAHVIKARLSELQSQRRVVIRAVGQQIAQVLADVEDSVICKARRALFGEDFAPFYEILKNRLVFLDGGKDDVHFLDNYVLLGNYVRDPDRFEAVDAVFQEFLREAGVAIGRDPASAEASDAHNALLSSAQALRHEIAALEEQREGLRKKIEGGGFFTKLLNSGDPSELKSSLEQTEATLKQKSLAIEELGPQLDAAKQQLDFFAKDYSGRLGDYLNSPDNAKLLFDASLTLDGAAPLRARLLSELLARLEQAEILYPMLASYEIRSLAPSYSPPVHLQQLRKAVVSKDEMKVVEQLIKQVPARRLTLKPIEELSKKIRRYNREELHALVLRFAFDFFRLHRDLRDAEHVAACMERLSLLTTEKSRELSRMNNRLYECLLQDEAKPLHDLVVSHVIIKTDVRGSTKMTQDLLARGLSPASHFSLNLHEPVKKLLDKYDAKKVFIEGDAIILAIFETESTRSYARPVARACILSRQILNVCNSYNDRAADSQLPPLELGIGVAFQGSAPTYWTDGESRIMISKALNLSDRLSGCAKLAKRLLTGQKSHFSVFQFLTALEGASAEELDEFLVRFNMNGIELNEEGFEKLSEEINLEKVEMQLDMPWSVTDSKTKVLGAGNIVAPENMSAHSPIAHALLPVQPVPADPAANGDRSVKKQTLRDSQFTDHGSRGTDHGSRSTPHPETTTLYYGEVPLGDSVELLVMRKALARELRPDGSIGSPSSHPYYEVCTSPALHTLVAALIRSQQAVPSPA
jgi:hypothetical protein